MNLSALNPTPPTSQQSSVAEAVSPGAPTARVGTEALNGADFARLLHHQVQAFKQQQRPLGPQPDFIAVLQAAAVLDPLPLEEGAIAALPVAHQPALAAGEAHHGVVV